MKHSGDIPELVLVIFKIFFFPHDSFLSSSLCHSHQEHFILLEIKLPKINSTLFVYEKSMGQKWQERIRHALFA